MDIADNQTPAPLSRNHSMPALESITVEFRSTSSNSDATDAMILVSDHEATSVDVDTKRVRQYETVPAMGECEGNIEAEVGDGAGLEHSSSGNGDVEAVHENPETERECVVSAKRDGVLILTIGSRGDLNPFLAIAEEFQGRGYHVQLGTHLAFKEVVERYGFAFSKLAGDPKLMMSLMAGSDSLYNPGFMYRNYKTYRDLLRELLEDVWNIIENFPKDVNLRLVVANPISHAGIHIAEYLKIPAVMIFTMPWSKSDSFPFPFYMSMDNDEKSLFNSTSYGFFEHAMWFTINDIINDWRVTTLKLKKLSLANTEAGTSNVMLNGRHVPFIYCWSKHVIPKPKDWGRHIMVSGYLMSKDDRTSILEAHNESKLAKEKQGSTMGRVAGFSNSNDLELFLQTVSRKDPYGPLYIGFGSINTDEEEIREIMTQIVRSLHLLACTKGSDGHPGVLGSRFVILQAVNHKEIFEQELRNRHNMCTMPSVRGLFRYSEPVLMTANRKDDHLPSASFRYPRRNSAGDIFGDENENHNGVPENIPSKTPMDDIILTKNSATRHAMKRTKGSLFERSRSSGDRVEDLNFLRSKKEPVLAWKRPGNDSITEEEAENAWASLQKRVLIIQEAKHSSLFPRCSCIVHHGGAGTFMTSVHAGVPQIVVPFFGDQFLWGTVVKKRKVGWGIPASSFSTLKFVRAIETCLRNPVRENATNLGHSLRQEIASPIEHGSKKAVDAILEWAGHDRDELDPDAPPPISTEKAPLTFADNVNNEDSNIEETPELIKPPMKTESTQISKFRGCSGGTVDACTIQ